MNEFEIWIIVAAAVFLAAMLAPLAFSLGAAWTRYRRRRKRRS